jgi:hypothetical protein
MRPAPVDPDQNPTGMRKRPTDLDTRFQVVGIKIGDLFFAGFFEIL